MAWKLFQKIHANVTKPAEIQKILDDFSGTNNEFALVWKDPNGALYETGEQLRRSIYGRGKKYIPRGYNERHNKTVDDLVEMGLNAEHLKTSKLGALALDNPITGLLYGAAVLGTLDFLEGKSPDMLTTFYVTSPFVLAGLVGNFWVRNRGGPVLRSSNPETARFRDSAQFLDMVFYFMRESPEYLENLSEHAYPVPDYSSLNRKQQKQAIKNIKKNKFILETDVKFGYTHHHSQVVQRRDHPPVIRAVA